MPDNRARSTRDKMARIYAVGIVAFIASFGSLTLLAIFLAHLK
jgi:uncharacterized protein (DUF2062 family)